MCSGVCQLCSVVFNCVQLCQCVCLSSPLSRVFSLFIVFPLFTVFMVFLALFCSVVHCVHCVWFGQVCSFVFMCAHVCSCVLRCFMCVHVCSVVFICVRLCPCVSMCVTCVHCARVIPVVPFVCVWSCCSFLLLVLLVFHCVHVCSSSFLPFVFRSGSCVSRCFVMVRLGVCRNALCCCVSFCFVLSRCAPLHVAAPLCVPLRSIVPRVVPCFFRP